VTALARELNCRDGNEVWDHLFESRLAAPDWQGFFTDVAHYCACIRAASDPARMEEDGTLARETQMRAILAEVRGAVPGPIVAVVGAFMPQPCSMLPMPDRWPVVRRRGAPISSAMACGNSMR
jgi:hypothetical protein